MPSFCEFIGKVDLGFERCHYPGQSFLPARINVAKCPLHLQQRLISLRVRFRGDEVTDRFGFEQVDAAVYECATGKLPSLSRTPTQICEGCDDTIQHGPASVQMEFCTILARIAVRRGKPEHEGPVQQTSSSITQ